MGIVWVPAWRCQQPWKPRRAWKDSSPDSWTLPLPIRHEADFVSHAVFYSTRYIYFEMTVPSTVEIPHVNNHCLGILLWFAVLSNLKMKIKKCVAGPLELMFNRLCHTPLPCTVLTSAFRDSSMPFLAFPSSSRPLLSVAPQPPSQPWWELFQPPAAQSATGGIWSVLYPRGAKLGLSIDVSQQLPIPNRVASETTLYLP